MATPGRSRPLCSPALRRAPPTPFTSSTFSSFSSASSCFCLFFFPLLLLLLSSSAGLQSHWPAWICLLLFLLLRSCFSFTLLFLSSPSSLIPTSSSHFLHFLLHPPFFSGLFYRSSCCCCCSCSCKALPEFPPNRKSHTPHRVLVPLRRSDSKNI